MNLYVQIGEEEALDFMAHGTAELEVAHTAKAFERLQEDYAVSTQQLGLPADLLGAEEFRERYFDSSEQYGALISRPAFGLHPLRYCRGLANAAIRHGAVVHEHSEVEAWQKSDDGWHHISTAAGALKARKVVFSTNGFMPEGLRPEFYARTLPVISAIIVTSALSEEQKAAHSWVTDETAANSRRILNYFRMLPDNRFLFGGRGHTSGHQDGERETYLRLEALVKEIWPKLVGAYGRLRMAWTHLHDRITMPINWQAGR